MKHHKSSKTKNVTSKSTCSKEIAISSHAKDTSLEALSTPKISIKKEESHNPSEKVSSKGSSSKKESTNADLPELSATTKENSSKKKTKSKARCVPESDESTKEEWMPSKVQNFPLMDEVLPRKWNPRKKDRPDPRYVGKWMLFPNSHSIDKESKTKCRLPERDESTREECRIPSKVQNIPWIDALLPSKYHRYAGKWMLFANCQSKDEDGLTELDVLWLKIEEMVVNGELYGAHVLTGFQSTKPSKKAGHSSSPPKEADHSSGTICCLTRNYRDEEDVKLTAAKISARLGPSYNGRMLYKTNEAKENGGQAMYQYLSGGSFWKRDEEGKWINKGKCRLPKNYESAEEECRIPSQVKNIPWIHAVLPRKYQPKKEDIPFPEDIGKWMLFANCESKDKDGLTELDLLWFKIEEMVKNGELYGAHVSTDFQSTKPPKKTGHGSGTICCLTSNYLDEEDVKLTAEKISARLGPSYNGKMIYKTNEAKENGGQALYQYLSGGSFRKRDEEGKWINEAKCGFPESDKSAEVECRIPSQVKNIPWIHAVVPRKYRPKKEDRSDPVYIGKWMLFPNCQNKDKDGLTELDVLWLKIEEMVENGELYGAHVSTAFESTKRPNEADRVWGTICCLTRDSRDEEDVTLTAEKISARLGPIYNGRMLYKTNEAKENGGPAVYQYLAEGSFWKRGKEGKWILL